MQNSTMPEGNPVDVNSEGPDDVGTQPGVVTPNSPELSATGGDEVRQQVEAMEERVLRGASAEVQEAVDELDKENPGPNKDVDPDEDVDPDRDEPA